MWNFIKRSKWLVSGSLIFVTLISVLGVSIGTQPPLHTRPLTIGQGAIVLRIGTEVDASSTVDYVCDGTNDNVQFQGALDALPANGGEIDILSGNYSFGATVTRAIPNVTIKGVGKATYLAYNAGTAIFTAGGNNWSYSNFRVDTTTAQLVTSMAATTLWSWENISTSDGYTAYRTDDATTASSWNIPTGRTASYVIAASDAPASVKAQADAVLGATGNDVQINAALVALNALGGKQKLQLMDNFTCSDSITAQSHVDVTLVGTITITKNGVGNGVNFTNIVDSTWQDVIVYRTGTGNASSFGAGSIHGSITDETLVLRNCKFINQFTSTAGGEGDINGLNIGNDSSSASPTLYNVIGQSSSSGNGYLNNGIDIRLLLDFATGILGTPKLYNCTGIGANTGTGGASAGCGIYISEASGVEMYDCKGIGGYGDGICINDCSPLLKDFTGIAGTGSNSSGVNCWCGGTPRLLTGEAISSVVDGVGTYGLKIADFSSPVISNIYAHPPINEYQFNYKSTNNGRFRPFATPGWCLYQLDIWVAVPQAGGTKLNIGTTIGGSEVAANIPIDVGSQVNGNAYLVFLTAGSYLYATPSIGIPDNAVYIYYTAITATNGNAAALLTSTGAFQISNSHFLGCSTDSYGIGVRILGGALTQTSWSINNSKIEAISTAAVVGYGGTPIYCDSPMANIPIFNSVIGGRGLFLYKTGVTSFAKGNANSSDNNGYNMQSSGTWTVTNGNTSIVVTHGLSWTPQAGDIAIGFIAPSNETTCYIDTYTSTQFTVYVNTASTGNTTGWWKAIR